jgi:two-component system NtrC family response regulator
MERAIQQEGYQAIIATNEPDAVSLLIKEMFYLVFLGLETDNNDPLINIKSFSPSVPIIMLAHQGTIEKAIDALKKGAMDYMTKPVNPEKLKNILKTLSASHKNKLSSTQDYNYILGKTPAIIEINRLIEKVAATNATVLITGESGTGKEVAAMSIHRASQRCNNPFVTVNCVALPEQLLESELFGHEKGAFTGAFTKRQGRFELAHTGTVFLDEIGDMPLTMQAKLLRILQEKSFERVGGTETLNIDVRVIAATNKNLSDAVMNGMFREDLYYRLNVIHIHLPPLRERKEDIPLLVSHFLDKLSHTYQAKKVSGEAMRLLYNYCWPGNIREMQNIIERAVIISQDLEILPVHLPPELQKSSAATVEPIIRLPDEGISLVEVEKQLIIMALQKSKGNQTKAAQLLGITRSALLYRTQKYGIPLIT